MPWRINENQQKCRTSSLCTDYPSLTRRSPPCQEPRAQPGLTGVGFLPEKILMKLSKAGLVSANASKAGGYQLGRSIEEISLKDVFYALRLHEDTIQFKHLSHSIFDDQAHVEESESKIRTTLENGLAAFYAQLDQLTLSQLLHQEAYENGAIDWEGESKTKKSLRTLLFLSS